MADGQLRSLFQQEITVLEKLSDLSLAKKTALLKDDLDSLEIIVSQEELFSKKLYQLDATCSKRVQFFLSPEKNSSNLTEEYAEEINKIRELSLGIKKTNEFNQTIIKDALCVFQFMINSLQSISSTETGVYGSSGQMVGSPKKTTYRLDTKG